MSRGTVLVADDDAAVRTVVNQALVRAGFSVRVTSNFATLWQWIENNEGDCIVSDVIMADGEAFDILPRIKDIRSDVPVILISAQNTFMTALKAQEAHVFEYFPKPFDLKKLVDSVDRAINEPAPSPAQSDTDTYVGELPIIGRSEAMQEIYRVIARLRTSNDPVLLTGESGTGKSLIARVIHDFGSDSSKKFHPVSFVESNIRAVDDPVFSETGTMYINDVLFMPKSEQARLLRILADASRRNITTGKLPRIIGATCGDIDQAVKDGDFDQDLLVRLSVLHIHVPPLRERVGDIPDLARHFLRRSELDGTVPRDIDPEGMQLLKQHDWPGNVRELENFVRQLSLLHTKEVLTEEEISESLMRRLSYGMENKVPDKPSIGTDQLSSALYEQYFAGKGTGAENGSIYDRFIEDYEQPLIVAALRATNGNQIQAAKILGLNRNTLRKKIVHHGIQIVKTVK